MTANGEQRTASLFALATIALLLFARPLVKQEVLTLRDHSDYFQPMRLFTAQEMARGRLPFWNPYSASGEPWLANPQTGVFYPPTWLFLILPFATAYTLYLALHVGLLGCGAFLFLHRLTSASGAFLGALTLMLCGPSLSLLDVTNTLTTLAWIPIVLWCALAMAPPSMCALAIAMSFLAGEPFFAACGALMFVLLRRRNIIDISLTAFALSAIQLFPFLGMLRGSDRAGGVTPDEILRNSVAPQDWIRLIVPPFFARGMPSQEFVPTVYVGIVASILAVVAVIVARRRRAVHVCVAVIAISVVVAAGAHWRPVAFLLTHLPVSLFRYPARMVPIAAMAIAALTAIGWDAIPSDPRRRWLAVAFACFIVVDLTPAIAPLLTSAPFAPRRVPYPPSVGRDRKFARIGAMNPVYRRAWISGYTNLFDRRFDAWTAAPLIRERYARAYASALAHAEGLGAMSVGYLLSDRELRGLPIIARSPQVRVYRNATALPLAYWRGDDGRIVPASLLAVNSTSIHVDVDAPFDGVTVVTQQNDDAWRMTIDGASAAAPSDAIFLTALVKRGHHSITWRYRPLSIFAGVFFSALGFLRMLLSFLFVKHAEKKNFFRSRCIRAEQM